MQERADAERVISAIEEGGLGNDRETIAPQKP